MYPLTFSVPVLKSSCLRINDNNTRGQQCRTEIDIQKLKAALSGLNVGDSRRRREIYNKLVLEAKYQVLNRDGLTFTDTLLLIAHNKMINEEKALS
jgi:hypothetical protein